MHSGNPLLENGNKIYTISVQAFMVFVIFAGNILVVVVFVKTPSLRTYSKTLVLSLTAADFMSGLGATMVLIELNVGNPKPSILCRMKYVPVAIWWLSALHSILVMTIDRYLGIVKPLEYQKIVTNRRLTICISVLWCYSFTGGALVFGFANRGNSTSCDFPYVVPRELFYYCTFNLALVSVVYIYCYTQIFLVARSQVQKMTTARTSLESNTIIAVRPERVWLKKENKYVRSILLVLVLFLVCWLPVMVLIVVELVSNVSDNTKKNIGAYRMVASFLCQISSILNPIVFTWRQPEIFRALKRIFGSNTEEIS